MWSGLQLTWTILLLVSQVWQVCRQMTTLEVSNVGRYGWMGGKGGTSLRDQSGAIARAMTAGRGVQGTPGASVFAGATAQGSLAALGAGPGPSGAEEDGLVLPDNGAAPIARSHGGGKHAGHGHSHRFGLIGKVCATASRAMGGPVGQLLGFDRFTKGKAVKGLTSHGGNPFDLGVAGVSRMMGSFRRGFIKLIGLLHCYAELSRLLDCGWSTRCGLSHAV
jgi:palmitoyltransferase